MVARWRIDPGSVWFNAVATPRLVVKVLTLVLPKPRNTDGSVWFRAAFALALSLAPTLEDFDPLPAVVLESPVVLPLLVEPKLDPKPAIPDNPEPVVPLSPACNTFVTQVSGHARQLKSSV